MIKIYLCVIDNSQYFKLKRKKKGYESLETLIRPNKYNRGVFMVTEVVLYHGPYSVQNLYRNQICS